jgi:hypothetical protein
MWEAWTVKVNTFDNKSPLWVVKRKNSKYDLEQNYTDIVDSDELIEILKWLLTRDDITLITIHPDDPD